MAKGARSQKSSSLAGRPSLWTIAISLMLTLSLTLLLLLALGIVAVPQSPDGAAVSLRMPTISIVGHASESDNNLVRADSKPWVELISWEPRAFVYHKFLSKEECEYLISLAKPHMVKSTVVDSATGRSKDSRVRTSSGTFLVRGQDKIIREVEKRIADFTFIPVEQGEGIQILHYEVGQKYEAHYDYFHDHFNTHNGGQRIATLLMYLSDVEAGGETVFPSAKVNSSSIPYSNDRSECGRSGLSVKPQLGDALLFWSMKPDATPDASSLHGGCPVISGNKWSATKWMRMHEYKI
ncbi:hypothetical protein L7F22_041148 [Adiantum nelumboides]|nr:hypothetical protein [Adiantum nelumboides]